MKTQVHRIEERQYRLFNADLEDSISALFRRCPTLCGFSVRDAAALTHNGVSLRNMAELYVTEVSVYPMRDLDAPAELGQEIVATLAELLDECPEACALLRDRTFARILQ